MPTASSRSLRNDFETFYMERDKEKKALYRHVFTLGGQLALYGGLLSAVMLGFVLKIPPNIFYSVVSPAIFLSMVGVVMITSVPVDALDLDSWLDSNPRLKMGGGILLCFTLLSLGVLVTLTVFPYVLGPLIVLFGVWVGVHHFPSLWHRGGTKGGAVAPEGGALPPSPSSSSSSSAAAVAERTAPPSASLYTLLTESPPPSSTLWCHLFSPHYLTMGISGTFWVCSLVTLNLLAIADTMEAVTPPFPLSIIPSLFDFEKTGVYGFFKLAVACGIVTCFVALLTFRFWRIARRARMQQEQVHEEEGVVAPAQKPLEKGWRTQLLYTNITYLCVTVAFTTFEIKLVEFLRAGLESTNFAFCALMVVLLLVGGLWSPLGGGRWAFNLSARAFELDLKRLRSDGAHLASLVSSSGAINDASRVHWVKRHTGQNFTGSNGNSNSSSKDCINRDFWILGHIIESSTHSVLLQVFFREDTHMGWGARYHNDRLVLFDHHASVGHSFGGEDLRAEAAPASSFFTRLLGGSAGSASAGLGLGLTYASGSGSGGDGGRVDPGHFSAWRAANFPPGVVEAGDQNGVVSVDELGGVVTLRIGISVMNMGEEAMLNWSMEHLRHFPWPQHGKFPRNLLLQSPRELSDERQQVATFALSSPVGPQQRLDYFLSHSWEDPAASKLEALQAYFHTQHPRSSPSLWFDKTCINRSSPEHLQNSIASLPVSMGTCNRVLILLGPTYLHRLWCVWELTSIFTFTVKELAVERIVVAVVGGGGSGGSGGEGTKEAILNEITQWTLDRAHCFDPNEEFRMRRLIFDIGVGRVTETIKALALCDFYEFTEEKPEGGTSTSKRSILL